jgi:hypothetical protein
MCISAGKDGRRSTVIPETNNLYGVRKMAWFT